ncbi:MAG: hypothetical protein OEM15_07150 [Myxococcales bacterium]|nr:hypothetical protein [Myxococcales bacterium]MDH3486097.1 hypothetical protein [Myxococcales bacterium]
MTARKWIYVLRGKGESHAAFADRMRGEVSNRLLDLSPSKLSLTLTEAPPPKVALFPFKTGPTAVFCIHDEQGDPARFTEALSGAASALSGYEVEESYPVAYDKSWRDGEPTPSPILLTVLHKKPGLDFNEYLERWHGGHTPLSLEIHPLWYYQRNVIREHITPGADACDGIVLEACPTKSDLLNPARFFGGALKMVPNMLRVANDIKGFLDMKKVETFYCTEYHLRS